jgi:hypothetical protein
MARGRAGAGELDVSDGDAGHADLAERAEPGAYPMVDVADEAGLDVREPYAGVFHGGEGGDARHLPDAFLRVPAEGVEADS